jgi:hypothetical protein
MELNQQEIHRQQQQKKTSTKKTHGTKSTTKSHRSTTTTKSIDRRQQIWHSFGRKGKQNGGWADLKRQPRGKGKGLIFSLFV